jgi:hypothetical protein
MLLLPAGSGANIAGGVVTGLLVPEAGCYARCVRRLRVVVAVTPFILMVPVSVSGASPPLAIVDVRPLPAGPKPSPIALMVCQAEAQREINEVLGVKAKVSAKTWVHHTYTCRYGYPNGSIELSVKELSSWTQTHTYFHQLGVQLGNPRPLRNLGQGAFRTSGGDVAVRKDWKVLLVNVSGLPSQFGRPPTSATDVAYTVADIILGCWNGD